MSLQLGLMTLNSRRLSEFEPELAWFDHLLTSGIQR